MPDWCSAALTRTRASATESRKSAHEFASLVRWIFDGEVSILHGAEQFDDCAIFDGDVFVNGHKRFFHAQPTRRAFVVPRCVCVIAFVDGREVGP